MKPPFSVLAVVATGTLTAAVLSPHAQAALGPVGIRLPDGPSASASGPTTQVLNPNTSTALTSTALGPAGIRLPDGTAQGDPRPTAELLSANPNTALASDSDSPRTNPGDRPRSLSPGEDSTRLSKTYDSSQDSSWLIPRSVQPHPTGDSAQLSVAQDSARPDSPRDSAGLDPSDDSARFTSTEESAHLDLRDASWVEPSDSSGGDDSAHVNPALDWARLHPGDVSRFNPDNGSDSAELGSNDVLVAIGPANDPAGTPRPGTPAPTPSPGTPTPTAPPTTPTPTPDPTTPPTPTPPACPGVRIAPGDDAAKVVAGAPAGAKFCFTKGLHRISATIKPTTNQVLTGEPGAILTGSVPLTRWAANGDDWVTTGALPPAYARTGQCEDNVANICHLREQVFLDGKHLTRVASRDKVAAGTFYADYAANAIYLGADPRKRSVEMSKTATAIGSGAVGVTVQGLTIEHFATPPQGGALMLGPKWHVTANEIRWNHAVGAMLVNADGAILEKNIIHHNGQLGVGQYSTTNGTIADNEVRSNNTDGFWIADWESGGIKTTWSTGGSVTGNLIKANRGVGLWSDAYDDRRTFSDNTIQNNAADGIRFEIGRNGVIENNVVTGNGRGTGRGSGTSLWDGGGINVNTSSNVAVRNNVVANNVNGIAIQSRTRGSGPWGVNVLRDITVTGNQITMRGGTTATGMVQNSGAVIPAGEVVLDKNTYRLDSLTSTRFQKTGRWYTARQWQHLGLDTTSTFLQNRLPTPR
ncbi:right-handed parallel beta-helix repeat-containing protein [Kribbella sp. NPDC005582]|uniref:right-handed parallel beta-helix repeat-containing protein n=1 Tax=Kribbella sp. NPDC005582 TaxID=3156893 RepID=UPI0033A00D8C